MAYAKTIDSNFGVVNVGSIEDWFYPSGGTRYGMVLSFDSIKCSVLNLEGAFIDAKVKSINSGYTLQQIAGAIDDVNSFKIDFNLFESSIAIIDACTIWLWGGIREGGVGFCYMNDPNHINEITVIFSNGGYHSIINEIDYYRYNVAGPIVPYRTQAQTRSCIFAYYSDTILFLCANYNPIPQFVFESGTSSYMPAGAVTDLGTINQTRQGALSQIPPFRTHLYVLGLDDSNVISRLGAIFDDEHQEIAGQDHLFGTWSGGQGIEPSPDQGNKEEEDYEEPDYEPSEKDRGKTEDDQFTIDAINAGLVTIFNPTPSEVQEFANFLFSGITEDIASFFKRLMSSPLDYIITMNLVHYKPEVNGSAEIKFGGIGSGVVSYMVTDQFQKISCGSVSIPRQFNSYMDWSGFTKAKIYLPYCGKHDIDIDLSMGATIDLDYYIDNLSGACVAQLVYHRGRIHEDDREVKGQIYEFTGNVFEEVPLSASDYRAAIQGVLTATAGVGSFVAGNPISGIGGIASGVMAMKPNIQHSGKAGSNYGYMGSQHPYIEVYRPNPAQPPNYLNYAGYPAAWSYKVEDLSGFIQARKDGIKLTDIPFATDEEINELKNLFETGVYYYV